MEKKRIHKKCDFCKKDFSVTSSLKKTKFCSKECYTNFQKTELNPFRKRKKNICEFCNKEFETKNYQNLRFCSIKCSSAHQSNINKVDGRLMKKCLYCNEQYKIFKYREKTSKFCSIKCHNQYRQNEIKCPSCNKTFVFPRYENRKFCSEKCSSVGIDKRKSEFSNEIIKIINQYREVDSEFFIKTNSFKYWCDIKVNKKTIIECYGDYWHCNPIKYKKEYYHSKIRKTAEEIWNYDREREKNIQSLNYNILIIWENDWNNNKELTIKKIIEFINNEI